MMRQFNLKGEWLMPHAQNEDAPGRTIYPEGMRMVPFDLAQDGSPAGIAAHSQSGRLASTVINGVRASSWSGASATSRTRSYAPRASGSRMWRRGGLGEPHRSPAVSP